jgi:putative transcriptional regulator
MIVSKLHVQMGIHKIKSIRQLSEETKISRLSLTRLYDGKAKGVEFDTLNTLCAFFKCSLSDLIDYVPDQEKGD